MGKVKHHKLPDVRSKYLFIDLFIFIFNFEEKPRRFLEPSAAFVSICADLSQFEYDALLIPMILPCLKLLLLSPSVSEGNLQLC